MGGARRAFIADTKQHERPSMDDGGRPVRSPRPRCRDQDPPLSFSRRILTGAPALTGGRDSTTLSLDGAHQIEPLIQTPASERNGIVSSDGRWLAYESDASGRYEIYVRPFPNVSAGQWLISTDGGSRALWSPNVRELFYVAPGGALMAVRVNGRDRTWNAGRQPRFSKDRTRWSWPLRAGLMTSPWMGSVSC